MAILIGKNQDEWPEIRKDLRKELEDFKEKYIQIFHEADYNRYLNILDWQSGGCSSDKWLVMPFMGTLIANTFNRPVYFFSSLQSYTIPPQRTPPSDIAPISFFLVGAHYNVLKLTQNCPLPPIYPAWESSANDEAKPWKGFLNERIKRYERIVEDINLNNLLDLDD